MQPLAASPALEELAFDAGAVRRHPLPAEAVRTLRYMQDIESYTLVYLRALLATPAIDDPDVAGFLASWLFDETRHGRVLARFLDAAGHPTVPRRLSRSRLGERLERFAVAGIAMAWPDFVAVHMTWGAINELTTLTGYRRLARLAGHPVLSELLSTLMRDESRHFGFYFRQAERRLARPKVARVVRALVERFWAPVGSGVQPEAETRFLADYLFGGADGRREARRIDDTIRRLPGFGDVALVEAWMAPALS